MAASCMLTIGMPVFNGERYIGAAIDSILRQTFEDFQLIVLDNASTDATAAIVHEYVRRDRRVLYRRNERNIGAGPNFNRVFAMCDSRYFKWAACDDEIEPSYLARCLEVLEGDPDAVLAHSYVRQIDHEGNPTAIQRAEYAEPVDDRRCPGSVYRPVAIEAESPDGPTRFRFYVMTRALCTEIFAVVRTEALAGTPLIASFASSDLALLAELALRGRFHIVPAPLFLNRDHPDRYSQRVLMAAYTSNSWDPVRNWFDSSKRSYQMDWWRVFLNYFQMINRHIPNQMERLGYYGIAASWLTVRAHRVDLIKDLLYSIDPGFLEWVMGQKRRLRRAR